MSPSFSHEWVYKPDEDIIYVYALPRGVIIMALVMINIVGGAALILSANAALSVLHKQPQVNATE